MLIQIFDALFKVCVEIRFETSHAKSFFDVMTRINKKSCDKDLTGTVPSTQKSRECSDTGIPTTRTRDCSDYLGEIYCCEAGSRRWGHLLQE